MTTLPKPKNSEDQNIGSVHNKGIIISEFDKIANKFE